LTSLNDLLADARLIYLFENVGEPQGFDACSSPDFGVVEVNYRRPGDNSASVPFN